MAPTLKRLANSARGEPAPKCSRDHVGLRQVAAILMRLDVPVRQIVKATRGAGLTNNDCNSDLTEFSKMDTPYGTVATTAELPAVDGGTLTIHCNNPFALLYAASTVSNEFGEFVHSHLTSNGGRGRLVLYTDETTPGNALRPDHGRSYEALLFTFADLPHWFINRKMFFLSLRSSKSTTLTK